MELIFDPSLVLYLPLHELSGASYISRDAYGHQCTVTGAQWTPAGGSFDGIDDNISLGNPAPLDITGKMSLMAWVNPADAAAQRIIASKYYWSAGADNGGYQLFVDAGTPKAIIANNGQTMLSGTSTLAAGAWYCLAMTLDATTLSIFVNGLKEDSASAPWPKSISQNLLIGKHGSAASYFKGIIGDVLLYARCLTSPEIQQNYLATKWRYR